jgi:hypothetical protein
VGNEGGGECCAVFGRGGVIGVAGAREGGGGGGARSGFQRKKTAGLTDRVGPPVSEGRRRAGLAGKGGRRWVAAGLEKKGGGRAETIARAEIQKSKKKNQF